MQKQKQLKINKKYSEKRREKVEKAKRKSWE